MCHFLCSKRVLIALTYLAKEASLSWSLDTWPRDVVNSSNESLHHADLEFGPNLQIGSPLQTIFQKVDVANSETLELSTLLFPNKAGN